MSMLVRIKPLNKKRGFKLRRYTVFGIKFQVEKGWHRVDDDVAEYLRDKRQDHDNPDSPKAFDVCTDAEALEMERKEKLAKQVLIGVAGAPLSTDITEDHRAATAKLASKRASALVVGSVDDGDDDSDLLDLDDEDDLGNDLDKLPEGPSPETSNELDELPKPPPPSPPPVKKATVKKTVKKAAAKKVVKKKAAAKKPARRTASKKKG